MKNTIVYIELKKQGEQGNLEINKTKDNRKKNYSISN